jgi:hypothetical protein
MYGLVQYSLNKHNIVCHMGQWKAKLNKCLLLLIVYIDITSWTKCGDR